MGSEGSIPEALKRIGEGKTCQNYLRVIGWLLMKVSVRQGCYNFMAIKISKNYPVL